MTTYLTLAALGYLLVARILLRRHPAFRNESLQYLKPIHKTCVPTDLQYYARQQPSSVDDFKTYLQEQHRRYLMRVYQSI